MNLKIKYSHFFTLCAGMGMGAATSCVLHDAPISITWVFNFFVFGIFFISGLVHGHRKWEDERHERFAKRFYYTWDKFQASDIKKE